MVRYSLDDTVKLMKKVRLTIMSNFERLLPSLRSRRCSPSQSNTTTTLPRCLPARRVFLLFGPSDDASDDHHTLTQRSQAVAHRGRGRPYVRL